MDEELLRKEVSRLQAQVYRMDDLVLGYLHREGRLKAKAESYKQTAEHLDKKLRWKQSRLNDLNREVRFLRQKILLDSKQQKTTMYWRLVYLYQFFETGSSLQTDRS